MGGRIGSRVVYVTREDTNEIVRLNPGDKVPADLAHLVTGRALAATGDEPVAEAGGSEESDGAEQNEGDGYAALDYKALKALAKERELPQDGKTEDLIARLREDDVERAEAGGSEESDGAEQNEE